MSVFVDVGRGEATFREEPSWLLRVRFGDYGRAAFEIESGNDGPFPPAVALGAPEATELAAVLLYVVGRYNPTEHPGAFERCRRFVRGLEAWRDTAHEPEVLAQFLRQFGEPRAKKS